MNTIYIDIFYFVFMMYACMGVKYMLRPSRKHGKKHVQQMELLLS